MFTLSLKRRKMLKYNVLRTASDVLFICILLIGGIAAIYFNTHPNHKFIDFMDYYWFFNYGFLFVFFNSLHVGKYKALLESNN